ncbi:MAG: hypothetical protein PHQ12_07480 [Chthoniobacteraceae bacterium]|nr:hypothetical protein [Chthoniobacteraceae bacterium]
MKLKITIEMDNAAFADDGNDGRSEAARILAIIARKLDQGVDTCGRTIDHNGNNVGDWKISGGGK